MDALTAQRVEAYLDALRVQRSKILRLFYDAVTWNHEHPDEPPITDDEVDPGGILRAMDRDLWQLIGDWEVTKAMGRFHRQLPRHEQPGASV